MLILEWTNKNVTEADLFIKLDKDEMDKLESIFPEIRKGWHKVFVNDISLAFGGQYNGYPPYGDVVDVEID